MKKKTKRLTLKELDKRLEKLERIEFVDSLSNKIRSLAEEQEVTKNMERELANRKTGWWPW